MWKFIILLLPSFVLASPCSISDKQMSCTHSHLEIDGLVAKRDVYYALPQTQAPAKGYPVAFIFQGSFFSIDFQRRQGDPFEGYNEILLIKELLDNGYMVVAPKAAGGLFWQTNIIGLNYEISADRYFIDQVLSELKAQTMGPADLSNLFAVGISSGGYMTDRMAISHKHTPFKALAIASASHATCGGPMCDIPDKANPDHPPTLFMHGKKDVVVPLFIMKKYEKLLRRAGVPTKKVIDAKATHAWLDAAPHEVLTWFNRFKAQ